MVAKVFAAASMFGAALLIAVSAAGEPAGATSRAISGRNGSSDRSAVTVGFLNEQEGAVAFPTFGAGAQAARIYLDHHGGIHGRPLRFLDCYTDGSTAGAVACANRFVAAHVPVVLEGISIGSDAAVPILAGAGIPLVGHTAFGNVQSNSSDAFFFGAATGAYDVVPLEVMRRDLHISSVTYMAATNPQDRGFVEDDSMPASRALGIRYKAIYYNGTSPNFQSTVGAAIATGAKALFFTAPDPTCTSLVAAARTLSYKGAIFAGSCSAFIKADGSSADGVFTASDLYVPGDMKGYPMRAKEQLSVYEKAMDHYAPQYTDGFAQDTFSSTMDLATALSKIRGRIDARTVLDALRRIDGQQSFMGQSLDCDGKQWPGERAACASGLIEYQVHGGRRVLYTKGFVNGEKLVK
ncbi:MAG: ABC transporter substrate-binding protein [Actinomycetota bacterium]|jgi:branched-chain amino acid transport system substrate-binding protein|nr:ABC transporter substrate-binding protein [Actinomycetota bacterium]